MTTEFEEKVYKLCRKVPRGMVTTYGIIAKKLKTSAYRAVGQVLRRNPYAPEVPCHRVVCSDGSVGGFRGMSTSIKKVEMLRKEGVNIKGKKIVDFEKRCYSFA